jgi:hypothetical protein
MLAHDSPCACLSICPLASGMCHAPHACTNICNAVPQTCNGAHCSAAKKLASHPYQPAVTVISAHHIQGAPLRLASSAVGAGVYATQHVRPTPVVTLDTRRSQRSKQQPSTSSSSTAATQQQEGLSGAAGTKAAADDKASSGPSAAGSRDGAAAAAGPASATSSRADRAGPMPVSSSSAGLQPGLIPAVGSPGGPQPSPADLQQAWQGLPEGSAPTPAAAAGALGLPALGLLPDMPGGLPALPTMQVSWVALPLGLWRAAGGLPRTVVPAGLAMPPGAVACPCGCALACLLAAPHPASMPTSSCPWLFLMPPPATLHPLPTPCHSPSPSPTGGATPPGCHPG